MKCLKMTHFPALNIPQNTPSPWLTSRQRPLPLLKMTHLPTLLPSRWRIQRSCSRAATTKGLLIVDSSCFPRLVILNGARNPTNTRETNHPAQGHNQETLPRSQGNRVLIRNEQNPAISESLPEIRAFERAPSLEAREICRICATEGAKSIARKRVNRFLHQPF